MGDVLEAMGWPAVVTAEAVRLKAMEMDIESVRSLLWDRKRVKGAAHAFEQSGYDRYVNEGSTDGRWRLAGRKVTLYARRDAPPREREACREEIRARIESDEVDPAPPV